MPDPALISPLSSKKILLRASLTFILFILVSYSWHRLFHRQLILDPYRGDVFRPTMYDSWAPFYLWRMPWKAMNGWICLLALSVSLLLIRFYPLVVRFRWAILFPCFLWLLFTIIFAASDHPDRILGAYGHYQTFVDDMPFFSGVGDVLTNYLRIQAQLNVHGQHYPPGYLVLLMCGGIKFFRLLNILAALGSIWLTWKLALELFDESTALVASFFLALMPGFLIYPSIDPVALLTCCSVSGLFLLHKLMKGKNYFYAFLLGLVLFLFSLFSFIVAVWGLFALLFVYVNRADIKMKELMKQLAFAALVLVVLFLVLQYSTGFSMVECLQGSVHRNKAINTINAYDTLTRYLFRTTQNLLGVVLSCLPVVIFSGFGFTKWGKAFLLTLLICACSGYFFGETERIFVFLQPVVAIATAAYLRTATFKTTYVMAFALCFSAVFEVLFHHFA